MTKPNIWAITATAGRHTLLERLVATFMAQDYEGPHNLLIYNNSSVIQNLAPESTGWAEQRWRDTDGKAHGKDTGKNILLINNHLDKVTGKPYNNLGAIYRDALTYVDDSADVITHMDDDDLFLPDHFSEGEKGLAKAKAIDRYENNEKISLVYYAYKPERSWFRHPQGLDLMGNNLEPSVFIDAQFLREYGYSLTTSDQHLQWFGELQRQRAMFIDPKGKPTLIYNWGDDTPTFKTSGNAGDPNNFNNYRVFSQDHGDRIITPNSRESLNQYYDAVALATPNIVNR